MGYKYRSGVSENTTKNLLIGPGAIFKGFKSPDEFGKLLGATKGGNTIKLDTEWHVAEIDGVLGPLMGGRWLTSANAQLESNLIEMTKENFKLKYPSFAESAFNNDYTKISHTGDIAPTQYETIAIVGEITGKDLPIIFVLENAAAVDAVEIPLGDGKDDVVLQVTWDGHYDPANPTKIPFYILYPEASSPIVPPVAYVDVSDLKAGVVTDTEIPLTWTNPVPEPKSIEIYVDSILTHTVVNGGVSIDSSYTLTGLTASTSYEIKVVAQYAGGEAIGVTITQSTTGV